MHHPDDADAGAGEGNLADFYEHQLDDQGAEIADSSADVGERLTEAREVAGETVEELSSRLGVSAPEVRAWEAGESSPPSNMLARAAGVLGVSPSWVLLGHGDEPVAIDIDLAEVQQTLSDVRDALRTAEAQLESLADRLTHVA